MPQKKLHEQEVLVVVKRNKRKFGAYGDLVDMTFLQYNKKLIKNQNPQNQTENDETSRAQYPDEYGSVDTKTNKNSAIP